MAEIAFGPSGGALTNTEAPDGNFCLKCYLEGHGGDPVNTENGDFSETFNDISIPGRSYPLGVTRTYNSANASANGPFGYGWTYNYGISLAVSGTSPNEVATITQEDGSQATFDQPASGNVWPTSAPRFIATLTYNSGSSTWTFLRQGQVTYTFNSSGELSEETDLNGYDTTLSYSGGDLSTVTDPAGRTLSFTWSSGRITQLTDANVSGNTRTVSYSYDGSGNLEDVTDVNGGDTHFQYNGSHELTVMKDPVCEATGGCPGIQNDYNGSGEVDWQKDQLNRETTFSYSGSPQSAAGGTTVTTDPAGNEVEDGYQWGLLISTTDGYGTSDAATRYYGYDPYTLALTTEVDPNGNVMAYTVDASGNVLIKTDPLGRVTTSTFNSFNEPLTIKDPNGVTTTYAYDGNGNLASVSTPLTGASGTATNCASPVTAVAIAAVTCYAHANGTYPGDVTSMTDPDGNVTYYRYDANGNQDEVKDPASNVTAMEYNNDGWKVASWTPKASCIWNSSPPTGCSSSFETQYSYVVPGSSPAVTNEFGLVGTVTDPLSHTTEYTYDADQHTLTTVDGNGNTTTNAYDLAGELCWTLPGGTSSNACASPPSSAYATTYNGDGTVATQVDGAADTLITYGYNHRGQVTSTEDAQSNTTHYTLDAVGNVLHKIDPSGTCTGTPSGCTTYTYDADNELTSVSYSDSSSEDVTSVTYDSDGQRTGMTDGTGTSSWTYDSLHRLTSYENGDGATVTYGYGSSPNYQLLDEPLTIAYPNSVGTVTQTWNSDGTLASVEDWNSKTVTFSYDANDNETGQTVPSATSVTDTFSYNDADQMTGVSDSNGTTLFSASYGRDGNGQVSTDSSVPSSVGSYQYTSQDQLCYGGSSNTNACGSPPSGADDFAFNSANDLTNDEGTTQQFNDAGELCWTYVGASANTCGTAPTGATTFGYNTKGDRTSEVPSSGSATCDGYDQANRLTSITTGAGSSCTSPTTVGTYGYDGDGLRESKTVSGTTTQFTWDGMGGNLLQQDAGGTITSWIYGAGGLPIEQVATSTTTYLHHDQLGSTRLITDSAGSSGTATTFTYDPQGALSSSSGSLTTPLMFSGQYLDSESGLYYLRARYYDPATAQFLSVDPDLAQTMQSYAYAGDDPVNRTDPSGMCPVPGDNNAIDNGIPCTAAQKAALDQFAAEANAAGPAAASEPDCLGDVCLQFNPVQGLEGGANFIEGFGNAELGTIDTLIHYGTFGQVNANFHLNPLPFCTDNPFVETDFQAGHNVGTIYGFIPGNPAADLVVISLYTGILKVVVHG